LDIIFSPHINAFAAGAKFVLCTAMGGGASAPRRDYFKKFRITKINKMFWEELIAYFPCHDTGHTSLNDASNISSIVAHVFVTAVTFLPIRCQAKIKGYK
jgi:hypothetical protein